MAIDFIGYATAQSSASVSAQPIILPANIIDNDIILLVATATSNVTWTTPTGYSVVAGNHVRSTSLATIAYQKVAVAADDAGATVVIDPVGSSQRVAVVARVYRGADTVMDVTATEDDGGASTSIVCPALTTVTDGDAIVLVGAQRLPSGVSSDAWVGPVGFGNQVQAVSTFGSNANAGLVTYGKAQATHGVTGPDTIGSAQSGVWISFTLAVKPLAGLTRVDVAPRETVLIDESVGTELFPDITPPDSDLESLADVVRIGNDDVQTALFSKNIAEHVGISELVTIGLFDDSGGGGGGGGDGGGGEPPPPGDAFIFTPPTVEEAPAGEDKLFFRYRLTRGITVLKAADGTYRALRYPTQDELSDSIAVYLGGHNCPVSEDEATALTNAGYGAYIQPT